MKKLFTLFICLVFLLISCGEKADDGKINAVATLFPQYDFARNIAPDSANVELLIDFGTDAHSYEPTPADIIKIANADLFIYTGDEMELWAKSILESTEVKKAVDTGSLLVVDLSKHVNLLQMHGHDHEHEEFDTHIWTSPENAKAMCTAIYDAFCDVDAGNEDLYKTALDSYCEKLDKLKSDCDEIANVAVNGTVYFGGSFAFRYLFDTLKIEYSSIYEGCASHAEPSASDIAKMAEKIKKNGVKYVFYDSLSEKKIADSIASECGAEVLHLHAVHNISKAEFDSGEDYISLMAKNLETLRKALF